MRVTLRFAYWLVLIFLLYAAYAYFRLAIIRLFLLLSLAALLFSFIQLFLNYYLIDLKVAPARSLVARGDQARWQLKIINKSKFSSVPVRLNSETNAEGKSKGRRIWLYGQVPAKSEQLALLSLPAKHCGYLDAERVRVAIADLFGFFYMYWPAKKVSKAFKPVVVCPIAGAGPDLSEVSLRFLQSGDILSKRPFDESEEAEDLRQMQPGDPLKKIHWKLSARVGEWMVKQYQAADELFWTLLCDVQSLNGYEQASEREIEERLDLRDFALDAAAALVEAVLLERRKLELKIYADTDYALKSNELSLYPQFLKALALSPTREAPSMAEQLLRANEEAAHQAHILLVNALDQALAERILLFRDQVSDLFLLVVMRQEDISTELEDILNRLRAADVQAAFYPYRREEETK